MVNNHIMVRCTFVAVIIFIVYVHYASGRTVYTGREGSTRNNINAISDHGPKHLPFLKSPDPHVVETVKRRIKARMKGRKPDQSNERNLWRSHPKKEDYLGPDSEEVIGVISSLGI